MPDELPKWVLEVIASLDDPQPKVRQEAAARLRMYGDRADSILTPLSRLAESDPDEGVKAAAKKSLADLAGVPGPPIGVSSGPRFSLAILGVATTTIVVSLIVGIISQGLWGGFDFFILLNVLIYPLLVFDRAPAFLLFGFAYLVPCIIAFKLPARMDRGSARIRVALSGCVAGLVYAFGLLLALGMFGM